LSPALKALLGRDTEIATLTQGIRSGARLVVVRGPRGVGKTTLASEAYRLFHELEMSMNFVETTIGHKRQLASILIDFLHAVGGHPAGLTTPAAIMSELTTAAEALDGPGLYYIDNLEPEIFVSDEFTDTCRAWLTGSHQVCLMITVRSAPPHRPWALAGEKDVLDLMLKGLTDRRAQLSLLGEELRRAHSEHELLKTADDLDGNPQQLLGLRWSRSDLDTYVTSVKRDDRIWESPSLFADWLSDSGLDDLCLALGLMRVIEYDVALLEQLWARGQNNEDNASADLAIAALLREQVLSPAVRTDALRIHPWVHRDLALLAESQPRRWAQGVHDTAANHFASALDHAMTDTASEYVYHALCAGRSREVWSRLVDDDLIEAWRRSGRSVQAVGIIDEFWYDVERRHSEFSGVERAELLVKRAHIASDMGQPRVCIGFLESALRELAGTADEQTASLRRAVWTQLAISHANLGEIEPCIQYYTRVIDADRESTDARTALAMGYLAYEYCDIGRIAEAETWIGLALAKCPRTRDASIFAKNLCNQGLVRFFALDLSGAAVSFDEAIDLVSEFGGDGFDVREHGRVLAHRGMVTLATARNNPADALALLDEAQALNERAGDRRRVYISMGRRGIAYARLGDIEIASRLLTRAAEAHQRLGDTRNLALDALALMALPTVYPDSQDLPALPHLVRRLATGFRDGGPLARYAAVWARAYCLMLSPDGSLSSVGINVWEA
jgi:tetratricopeptide (TPR) repeat protein